jgi:hypothetical protein
VGGPLSRFPPLFGVPSFLALLLELLGVILGVWVGCTLSFGVSVYFLDFGARLAGPCVGLFHRETLFPSVKIILFH